MLRLVIDDKEMSKEDTGQVRSGTGICFTNSDELQPIEVRTVEGPRRLSDTLPSKRKNGR
jgi:hypothetical protein